MSREHRDRQLFDSIARKYMRKDSYPPSALARKAQLAASVQAVLNKNNDLGVVIDIGCGVGAPAKYLLGAYRKYIGIDQSGEMIRFARTFHRDNPDVEFIAGNIKEIHLAEQADTLLSVGALHHMTALDTVLENLKKFAKPGGTFVVIEPQNANPFIQFMRWVRGKIDKSYSQEQIFFSEAELRNLLSRHDFENIQVTYQGYFSPPFAQVIIPPQAVSIVLSRLAIQLDGWLQARLQGSIRKLSFNIIVTGNFP